MHPKIASSLDGIPPLFYQTFWSFVGDCVTKLVLDFLNLGCPHFENKNPSNISDYRPISLCNMVYKLASKTPVNRMKSVLSSTVSEIQNTFTKGYFITDNVLVAFETMHHVS